MSENRFLLICLIFILGFSLIWCLPLASGMEKSDGSDNWRMVLDLTTPEKEGGLKNPCGIVSIAFSRKGVSNPEGIINQILGGIGDGGQYATGYSVENTETGDNMTYVYELVSLRKSLLSPEVPTIHQDNVGENYCFYVYHSSGIGASPWWEGLGCDSLSLKIVLPENYELREDVVEEVGKGSEYEIDGQYRDNEYSVFTTATGLETGFENGRRYVEAGWTLSEFDYYNIPYYLEFHYRKFHYRQPFYSLDLETAPPEGGAVSPKPPGGSYKKGENVTVTASPASGYEFDRWTGDISDTENQIKVKMDSDKSLTAHFEKTGGGPPLLWIGVGVLIFLAAIGGLIYKKK